MRDDYLWDKASRRQQALDLKLSLASMAFDMSGG